MAHRPQCSPRFLLKLKIVFAVVLLSASWCNADSPARPYDAGTPGSTIVERPSRRLHSVPRRLGTDRPAATMDAECASQGDLGDLVAPAKGTLTAQDTVIPFKTVSNKYTRPIIRLPTTAEVDPNGLRSRPFPTSAWFTNLMWGGPKDQAVYGEDPVQVFPYYVKAVGDPNPNTPPADRGLWFNKPFYTGDVDAGVIFAQFPELQLTTNEMQNSSKPLIQAVNWDDLSLTMKFLSEIEPLASMEVPLVKGSPYITALFPNPAHPILRTPRDGAGGATLSTVEQIRSNKLKVVVQQVPSENQHTWLLWTSSPIKFSCVNNEIAILDANPAAGAPEGSFSGVLRLAFVPDAANSKDIEAMLDTHVDTFPTGGSVKVWSKSGQTPAVGSYRLTWSTQSMSNSNSTRLKTKTTKDLGTQTQGPAQLLMLALPHHMDTLTNPSPKAPTTTDFPLGFAAPGRTFRPYLLSVRGPMIPVLGSCWLLQEKLVPVRTEVDVAVNLRNITRRKEIERTLLDDLKLVLPSPDLGRDIFADWPAGPRAWPWKGMMNLDAYYGGSEMHAMATLIGIARGLQKTSQAAGSNFSTRAAAAANRTTNALKQLLLRRLSLPCDISTEGGGANPGALCYDDVFKVVSTARAIAYPINDGVDFFSRTGTDHHFHWGYWVSAAATIASEDLDWYQKHLESYINTLLRDYVNNDDSDPSFVFARHKDWYMGHSWAAGLQLSADGKNQESSSEAVNSYRAVALLGAATGNKVLEGWGRFLMSQEINAARIYTQVYKNNDIYQLATGSAQNGITQAKVATILFAAKASAYNWFDPDILTRHGIQWMPFTPSTNQLLPQAWLRESIPLIRKDTKVPTDRYWKPDDQGGGPQLGWRVLLTMSQSMLPGQRKAAWNNLLQLPIDANDGYALCGDIGRLTRTSAKWWIATRPRRRNRAP